MSSDKGRGFLRYFFTTSNIIGLVVLMIVSHVVGHLWIFQYPGIVLMQAVDENRTPELAADTVIVTITPKEYREVFENKSPLKADRLKRAIDTLLKFQPAIVAVDIDTTDKSFQTYRSTYLDSRFVWARGLVPIDNGFRPAPFLGQDSEDSRFSGIAGFERDADWTVRKINGCVTLGDERLPVFHRAIYLAYLDKKPGGKRPDACELKDFAVRAKRIPYMTLTEVEAAAVAGAHNQRQDNLLAGKIVILGGRYSYADYHPGPAGLVAGVELVASAVEAQMSAQHGGWWHTPLALIMDFFLGMLVSWFYYQRWRPFVPLFATLATAAAFLFVPGVLLYLHGFLTSNPFVLVVGMLIGQLYESAESAARADHESHSSLQAAAG